MFCQTADSCHTQGIIQTGTQILGLKGGFTLQARPISQPLPASPILDDIHTIWDQTRFARARHPIPVTRLQHPEAFSASAAPSCADMPIKFPGQNYKIPAELQQFRESLQACVDFENAANPHAADYYAYLTIDQRPVERNKSQRPLGLHSDSVQGARIQPKVEIEHTYLCVDRDPTSFMAQSFNLEGYDADRDWLNAVFDLQADPAKKMALDPYTVAFFDAYTVHTAELAKEDGMRTMLRLIYSVRQFDRLGNTHNALFDYQWDMQPRPLPSHLRLLKHAAP